MRAIHYEVTLDQTTKAALERFGRAVLLTGANVHGSHVGGGGRYPLGRGISAYVTVSLDFNKVELFRDTCQPWEMKYRSPTRFDNGSIIAIYKDPEEELAATEAYWAKAKDISREVETWPEWKKAAFIAEED